MSVCPSEHSLETYLTEPKRAQHVCAHVETCPRCRERLEEIKENIAFLRSFADHASDTPDASGNNSTGGVVESVPGYDVVRVIGRGGQAVVYEAVQRSTSRHVALKVVMLGRSGPARRARRFEREAVLAAGLRHPNIVTVFDSGFTMDGQPFLAMELIDGAPINQRIGAHTDPRDTIRAMLPVCDAIRHAHQRGVIHRDIKPSNILVDTEDIARVLDFGLAKAMHGDADAQLTLTGEFMGTLAYAAPEQVRGSQDGVGTRADVYALGVVLYEALTGSSPYPVDGPVSEVVQNICERPPRLPSSVRVGLSNEIDTVLLHALAKDPERRYQSAAELLDDLKRLLDNRPIGAKRDSTWYVLRKTARRHRAVVVGAFGFVTLLAAFGATMAALYGRARVAENESRVGAERLATILTASNVERGSLMWKTGNVPAAEGLIWREYLRTPPRDVTAFTASPTSPPGPAAMYWALWEMYAANPCVAAWRPHDGKVASIHTDDDGRLLTVGMNGSVRWWDVSGVAPSLLDDAQFEPRLFHHQSSHRWVRLWRNGHGAICVTDAIVAGDERCVANPDGVHYVTGVLDSANERLVCVTDAGDAHVWRLSRGAEPERLRVLRGVSAEGYVNAAWAADGRLLLLDAAGVLHAFDPDSFMETGRHAFPHRLARASRLDADPRGAFVFVASVNVAWLLRQNDFAVIHSMSEHTGEINSCAFCRDGCCIATTGYDQMVCVWSTETGRLERRLRGHSASVVAATFLDSHTLLATCDAEGIVRLWDVDGEDDELIELPGWSTHGIAWSTDGAHIVLVGANANPPIGDPAPVRIIDSRTRTEVARLDGHTSVTSSVAFSPDGSLLAASAYDGTVRVWDMASGVTRAVLHDRRKELASVVFSPDGRRIATSGGLRSDYGVRVWDLESASVVGSMGGFGNRVPGVAWCPNGALIAGVGREGHVILWNGSTYEVEYSFVAHDVGVRVARFSPDGRTLVTAGDDWIVRVWDVASRREMRTLVGHRQRVFALAFSPDGSMLASGDSEGHAIVWDFESGDRLVNFDCGDGMVFDLDFSPDGRALAAATSAERVFVWDLCAFERHIAGNLEHQAARLGADTIPTARLEELREWARRVGATQ